MQVYNVICIFIKNKVYLEGGGGYFVLEKLKFVKFINQNYCLYVLVFYFLEKNYNLVIFQMFFFGKKILNQDLGCCVVFKKKSCIC